MIRFGFGRLNFEKYMVLWAVMREIPMQAPADSLMSDLNTALATHRGAATSDTELRELYKVAEAALEMLALVRHHQLERARGGSKSAMIG